MRLFSSFEPLYRLFESPRARGITERTAGSAIKLPFEIRNFNKQVIQEGFIPELARFQERLNSVIKRDCVSTEYVSKSIYRLKELTKIFHRNISEHNDRHDIDMARDEINEIVNNRQYMATSYIPNEVTFMKLLKPPIILSNSDGLAITYYIPVILCVTATLMPFPVYDDSGVRWRTNVISPGHMTHPHCEGSNSVPRDSLWYTCRDLSLKRTHLCVGREVRSFFGEVINKLLLPVTALHMVEKAFKNINIADSYNPSFWKDSFYVSKAVYKCENAHCCYLEPIDLKKTIKHPVSGRQVALCSACFSKSVVNFPFFVAKMVAKNEQLTASI